MKSQRPLCAGNCLLYSQGTCTYSNSEKNRQEITPDVSSCLRGRPLLTQLDWFDYIIRLPDVQVPSLLRRPLPLSS